MLGEFSLIREYFQDQVPSDALGVGDDAARIPVPGASQVVVCKDLLIEGRHFFSDVNPVTLGHKALAVNLSDLAAMGASPLGYLLGIGLRTVQPDWLKAFSEGMIGLGHRYGCPLIGGDTVRVSGELVISVTALGTLPAGQGGLLRQAAEPGDDIWVSGYLGAAHIALSGLQGDRRVSRACIDSTRSALEMPEPRVALGLALLGLAHAAIDISDGLAQDLGHILDESGCAARLHCADLPIDPRLDGLPQDLRLRAALTGGDDYELCFTAPASKRADLSRLSQTLDLALSRVGVIEAGAGLSILDTDGRPMQIHHVGFDHFRQDVNGR